MLNSVAVGIVEAEHVAGELDHHAPACPRQSPRYGISMLAGVARRLDHALDAAIPEAARHDDAVEVAELRSASIACSSCSESTHLILTCDVVVPGRRDGATRAR